jgi:uncharacterized membrane protein YtjA (UPF0391 family)
VLRYAAIFLVCGLAAAALGFGDIAAAGPTELAKVLCYVFLLVTMVLFVLGMLKR